jgi:hypothetical protein
VTAGTDPFGKRALYWMPVGDEDDPAPAGPHSGAPSGGKRALFTAVGPAHGANGGHRDGPSPEGGRGSLRVTCSSCGAVSRVGLVGFAALHLPVAAWLPRREFDRWMRCPACRTRTWLSVTLAR